MRANISQAIHLSDQQKSELMGSVSWEIKSFNELSPAELYSILQLRNEVFIVEQNCPYQDMDNKDQQSYHLMGLFDNKLVAYTRILPPGVAYEQASIGRVVTSPHARRTGLGKELMVQSIDHLYRLFQRTPIKIGAQLYLKNFYEALGFSQVSDIYLEDGIQHISMIKNVS